MSSPAGATPGDSHAAPPPDGDPAVNWWSLPAFQVGRASVAWTAAVLLVVVLGLTVARIIVQYQTPGPFDETRQGLCDFHNGIYFPAKALTEGVSPYGSVYAAEYPVARSIPFFSPGILALHAPLTRLPLTAAETLFTILNVVLLFAIAASAAAAAGMPRRLDAVFCIALAIMISRGGHVTVFDGYFTFQLILATFLAITWAADSPWKAAMALAVVSAKPTYILPLGFLLLARGNYRALIYGAGLSVLFAGVPFAWLAYHEGDGNLVEGFQTLRMQIEQSQDIHRADPNESPLRSWTRLDLLAVIAKWANVRPGDAVHLGVMALILAVPMAVLRRRRSAGIDDGLGGLTGALILVAILVSLYHQSYDALLMVVPAAGLLLARRQAWVGMPRTMRVGVFLLAAFPAYNFVSTQLFLVNFGGSQLLFLTLTSLNGVSLAVMLIVLILWSRAEPATLDGGQYRGGEQVDQAP